MKKLVYFAPCALGELIQQTPLIEALSKDYDVTIYGPQAYVPAFNRLGICDYKSIVPWLDEKVHGHKDLGIPWAYRETIHLVENPCEGKAWVRTQPCTSVLVGGEVPPGQVQPSKGFLPGSHSRNLLNRFGFNCDSTKLHINEHPQAPRIEVAILSGPSWDNTRRIPGEVIRNLCEQIPYPCHLVGAYQSDPPPVTGECAVGEGLTSGAVKKALSLVGRSTVVVGTDCGFAYAALAMGKRAVIIQSRAAMEHLVPANYQSTAFPFRKLNLGCDLVCKIDPISALGVCTHWNCFKHGADGADCTELEGHDIRRLAKLVQELCRKK